MTDNKPIRFKDVFKGIEYNLTFKEWEEVTGLTYSTIYDRYAKWKKGKFPRDKILFLGVLPTNKNPPKPKPAKIDISWLYWPERPATTELKEAV